MKVLVISQYFPPDAGGGSTRASNAVIGLRQRGCDVRVISAFPHYPHGRVPPRYRGKALESQNVHGIKLIRVWIPALPHDSVLHRVILHLSFAVSSLFAAPFIGQVDVIWAANPNLFSIFPALIYSLIERRPIIRNVDDLWPEVFYDLGLVKSKLLRYVLDSLAWLSYAVAAAITPISPGYKRQIVKKYKINGEKIHVVEVGVKNTIKPTAFPSKATKDTFVLMYSGALGVGYDFEIVLKAAHSLLNHDDIAFVIRGMGEREPKIRRIKERLKLRNVSIDTRYLPRPQLLALLSSADAFLLPMKGAKAVEEGLPTKIFEYQALGKPIICSSRGEPAAYITSTKSGIVVEPGDYEAFTTAILTLYEDRKLALKLGTNGYRNASENLTTARIGERLHAALLAGAQR